LRSRTNTAMAEERRGVVTLSKAQAETAAGRELVDLPTELSADGNVTREEMDRLRAWLEVDRGVDFPAMSFLYETIDQISADGEITEDELDLLVWCSPRTSAPRTWYSSTLTRVTHTSASTHSVVDKNQRLTGDRRSASTGSPLSAARGAAGARAYSLSDRRRWR